MKQGHKLFFIALLPPLEVQKAANEIKEHFATFYQSRAALKSPPHITLQPPFECREDNLQNLTQHLQSFVKNHAPVPMILDGFGSFKPRVIYINVVKTPNLLKLQQDLMMSLETDLGIIHLPSKNRAFSPHLTVGFKDLTKENFYRAWSEFSEKPFHSAFVVPRLSLLMYHVNQWNIIEEFDFIQ